MVKTGSKNANEVMVATMVQIGGVCVWVIDSAFVRLSRVWLQSP
jgi:hypothetical protein